MFKFNFFSISLISFFSFIIILLLSYCFFIPIFQNDSNIFLSSDLSFITSPGFELSFSEFVWPTPGYTTITSPFGYRVSPTSGASTNHSGIDIAAPTNSNIVAIFSGTVTYIGFSGAGGYTVTIKNNNYTVSYCHVSPIFLVYVGQYVNKGDIIATVGPKNVYGVPNNPYKDSNGTPTNGATTGPHLHLTLKKDGKAVNPLDYF